MRRFKSIKGAQIPPLTPNDLMPECIRTTKVYDWIMDVNRYTNKTPIPGDPADPDTCAGAVAEALQAGNNLRFECTPPDLDTDDAVCEVLEAVPGSPTGRINVLWTVIVTVTVINQTTGMTLCSFDVPVQFDDEYAVCLPEPFDEDNVFCRITQVNCSVANTVFLGNQVAVSVTVCKDIQIEEEVKLEVLGKFCQPRPNDIPVDNGPVDECPGFEFPPQCDFFPRPNCDCQGEADVERTVMFDEVNRVDRLTALICDNCTLSQSTWMYSQTDQNTDATTTVMPTTIDEVVCEPFNGGIRMTVTGLANVTGSQGNFSNTPYELVLTDAATKTYRVQAGPINTEHIQIDDDDTLVVEDCVTFDDILDNNTGLR